MPTATPPKALRLILVRHGETEWSLARRHTGRTDLPLTAHGKEQAASLAPILAGTSFARVLTSPLERARHTAELAGFPQAEHEDALMEVDYGKDEGRTSEAIRIDRPGWSFFEQGPLDGETFEQVHARVSALLARLAEGGGDVLCFAHGHLLRILAATFIGAEPRFGRHLLLAPATVSVLGHEHGTPAIARWNFSPGASLLSGA